jgi:hypothetical protein
MDYIFASTLQHLDLSLPLIVSYDIVCQWSKHLATRLKGLPDYVRPALPSIPMKFVIPKLHLQGHILSCQEAYSFNFLQGSGQMDGEGVERPWASIGPMAASTKEMGPGARQETLSDHWSFWNWKKLTGFG